MSPVYRLLTDHFGTFDRHKIVDALEERLSAQALHVKRRVLFGLLDDGYCPPRTVGSIVQALGEPAGTQVREALAKPELPKPDAASIIMGGRTAAQDDPSSAPCLWIRHEHTMPSPLFIVAVTGLRRWKVIDLPENIASLSVAERKRIIRQTVAEHRASSIGHISLFGHVTGYLYCPNLEHTYQVNTDGQIESFDLGPFSEPIPRIWMGVK